MNDSLASSTKSALFAAPSTLRRSVIAAFILAVAAVGCGASSEEPTAPAAATEEAAETSAQDGFDGMFTHAASKLNLSAQQRQAVEAIKVDLKAKAVPVREAKTKLQVALAEGVAKGSVDAQVLAVPAKELSSAVEAFKPALQDGLNRLHATLDKGQREKLVDMIEDRIDERRDAFFEGGGPRGRMKKIVAELDLSKDQIQKIRSSFLAEREAHEGEAGGMKAKRAEMRAHLEKVAEAFKSDSFDARALDVGKQLGGMATLLPERASRMLSIAIPVLTPEQRAKLAVIIKEHGAGMNKASDD